MSDDTKVPNPDLLPAGPAITKDEAGNYVIDPARLPKWRGPCNSCAHFQAIGRATEHRQVYTDKAGVTRQRLFLSWQRFCLVGPEVLEMADDDLAWCSKWELHPDGGTFAAMVGSPIGNTPFSTEDE
jgi:hypothetical protein